MECVDSLMAVVSSENIQDSIQDGGRLRKINVEE